MVISNLCFAQITNISVVVQRMSIGYQELINQSPVISTTLSLIQTTRVVIQTLPQSIQKQLAYYF